MGTPGRRQLQKIQIGKETQAQGTPAKYFSRARVAGGMLNDQRSINMVDEMLGIIPGQTRSYVTSADGQIALGGTPMSPQQLPIHTANAITGITYGTLSVAARQAAVAGTGTLSISTSSTTLTTGSPNTLNAGDLIYDNIYTYVGTIAVSGTNVQSFTLVNYANINVTTGGNGATWYKLSSTNALASAFTYDITLPTSAFPTNNVSYTIQAGDDFEQETTTYAKCMGFSSSGSSGGTIDLSASYMTQAVRLGVDAAGTITTVTSGLTAKDVSGSGTNFIASDVGRKLYTTGYVLIGTIASFTSATSVTLAANALVAVTNASFYIGGFSQTTIPTPIEDLIFARTRLYIDEVAAFPIANPTPVVASYLAFSAQLQCSWVPKFTGEGYQGIDPTWSFALMTNYALAGDFTIEHNETASGQYSASPVESLKYAWRNRVPKIIQIDCPGSTQLNWFTPNATTLVSLATGTITVSGTSVTGSGTSFASSDVGKDLFTSTFGWIGRIASYTSATSVTLAAAYTGTTVSGATFYMASITQPYFPVPGQGPLKTYTGLSYRIPIQILNVSGLNDQSGNDIVTVQWQQRYNDTAASAGDIRIVNQIASMPVAG